MLQETQAHPGVTLAVCGFAFSADRHQVALVRKLRPAFQAGLLNGIGGKIEPGERPVSAMVREFREETGYLTKPRDWQRFLVLDRGQGGAEAIGRVTRYTPLFTLQELLT